ncbi:hypothetical protein SAMN05445850_7210 [Paraburkholderia tuberum]|uniref:Uncharacterized protein n=1 Tax=Paraburkholderia tuberum TaxID=157910 RepID=A0A1H1KDW0_9BURK|nr:hypothetical protein SAMN05445850_7210 [Paraburkholderia tuberum]
MRTFRCLDVGMRTGPVSNVPQSICNQQMRFTCWPGTDIQQAATGSPERASANRRLRFNRLDTRAAF